MPNTLDPRLNSDPDIAQALRGEYGQWAGWAAQLPQAWDAATRNRVVAQQIATDKGINVSGMRVGGNNQFEDANKKTWLDHIVDASPYIMGGIAGAGALGAFGGGTGGATSTYGPLAGGYGGATTDFAIPAALDAGGLAAAPVAGDVVSSAIAAGTGPPTVAGPSVASVAAPASAAGAYGPLANAYGDATTNYNIPAGLDPNYAGDVTGSIPNGYPGSEGYAAGNTYPNGIPNAGQSLLGLDPKWSPLLKALAGVGGIIGGKIAGNSASQNAVSPQLNQLLDLAMQRANSQTPLYNAVNQGFYDMLPTFAKKGGG